MIHRTLALLILLAVPMSAAAQDLGKDDVVKLKKAGVDDATILKVVKASSKKVDLSSDEIVELIGAGISEEVINAMLRGPEASTTGAERKRPPNEKEPTATSPRMTQISVENATSRPFWVTVNAERRMVHFSSGARKGMAEVPRGKGLAVTATAGSYTVCWCGASVDLGFGVSDGKTVTLRVAEEDDDDCCGGPVLSIEVVREAPKEPGPVPSDAVYACPMHPDVTSKQPGKCRKCGMKLERAKTGNEAPKEEKKQDHKHDRQ